MICRLIADKRVSLHELVHRKGDIFFFLHDIRKIRLVSGLAVIYKLRLEIARTEDVVSAVRHLPEGMLLRKMLDICETFLPLFAKLLQLIYVDFPRIDGTP